MQFSPTGADGTYTDISNGSSQLFLVSDRWEPGTVITRYIKIVNTSDMEIDTVLSIQKSDISGDLLEGLTISVDGGAFEPLADKFVGSDFTQIGTATIPGTGPDKEHIFNIAIKLDDTWHGTGGTVQFFLKTLATKAGT